MKPELLLRAELSCTEMSAPRSTLSYPLPQASRLHFITGLGGPSHTYKLSYLSLAAIHRDPRVNASSSGQVRLAYLSDHNRRS